MAERRMFAKNVIDSDLFLDMPLSTQALYFHLAMRADDDGFVNNPNKIMRMIGAESDSLKLLAAKKFIIPFESGVVVIRHWKIHNYIKKDRYQATPYVDEMSQLTDENGVYTKKEPNWNQIGTEMEPEWNQNGSKMDTQDRLGKVSLGKDRLDNNNARAREEAADDEKVPFKKIMELYNTICVHYPSIRDINGKRKQAVSARYKANPDIEIFRRLFEKAEASKFLQGNNDRGFKADFDFMMNASKFDRLLEGAYDDREQNKPSFDTNEVEKMHTEKYKKLNSNASYDQTLIEQSSLDLYKDI